MGVFSFFPTKNLGGYGDGGLVTGRIPEFVEMARMLRNFDGITEMADIPAAMYVVDINHEEIAVAEGTRCGIDIAQGRLWLPTILALDGCERQAQANDGILAYGHNLTSSSRADCRPRGSPIDEHFHHCPCWRPQRQGTCRCVWL